MRVVVRLRYEAGPLRPLSSSQRGIASPEFLAPVADLGTSGVFADMVLAPHGRLIAFRAHSEHEAYPDWSLCYSRRRSAQNRATSSFSFAAAASSFSATRRSLAQSSSKE